LRVEPIDCVWSQSIAHGADRLHMELIGGRLRVELIDCVDQGNCLWSRLCVEPIEFLGGLLRWVRLHVAFLGGLLQLFTVSGVQLVAYHSLSWFSALLNL
jgi:hypothetical protein